MCPGLCKEQHRGREILEGPMTSCNVYYSCILMYVYYTL